MWGRYNLTRSIGRNQISLWVPPKHWADCWIPNAWRVFQPSKAAWIPSNRIGTFFWAPFFGWTFFGSGQQNGCIFNVKEREKWCKLQKTILYIYIYNRQDTFVYLFHWHNHGWVLKMVNHFKGTVTTVLQEIHPFLIEPRLWVEG